MGKKRNLDFKKTKIKIGKHKPSNNVTKFNIKTSKIVIRESQSKKSEDKDRWSTFFSVNEKDLQNNLKNLKEMIWRSIKKKSNAMLNHKLDITQSVWKTLRNPRWVTPWDDIIKEFHSELGVMVTYIWIILNNAANHKNIDVNEESVKCINLYLKLFENHSTSIFSGKETIKIIYRYMKSTDKKKQLLALDLLTSLSKFAPYSFWFAVMWRSAVFVLKLLNTCLNSVNKLYESLIDRDRFLELAALVIPSVIDGRRAGLVVVGEDVSQLEDVHNPPFDDLYYNKSQERVDEEKRVKTDIFDEWSVDDMRDHEQFNLNDFLSQFCEEIIKIGLSLFPVSVNCEKSLRQLLNVIKILGRCCMRVNKTSWKTFIDRLMSEFPFILKTESETSDNNNVELLHSVEKMYTRDLKDLSKSERKLHHKRLELEKQMLEKCRNFKTVSNSPLIRSIMDEINFHIVALIFQYQISCPENSLEIITKINEWEIGKLKEFVNKLDVSRNEFPIMWMNLTKQMIRLSEQRNVLYLSGIQDLLISFAHDLFLHSHSESKVKKIALSVYVQACLFSVRTGSIINPPISSEFWTQLVDLLLKECTNGGTCTGLVSAHPAHVSNQIHFDITVIKAAYMLLMEHYFGVSELFRMTDESKKIVLKECFDQIRQNIRQSQYEKIDNWNDFYSKKMLHNIPKNFFWDYFTYDLVCRKEALKEKLKPLCSLIDDFLFK